MATTSVVLDCSSKLSFDDEAEIQDQTPADLRREEFDSLLNDVVAMKDRLAGHFTFKTWFAANKDLIVRLRSMFPERGSHDKVEVRVNGHDPEEVTWEEFVTKYLGITPQYLNRVLSAPGKGIERGLNTQETVRRKRSPH